MWGNLQANYPDAFGSPEEAKAHLAQLANIPSIQAVIDSARAKRDEILAKRLDEFLKTKTGTLYAYRDDLQKSVSDYIAKIENSDIEVIKKQLKGLEKQKNALKKNMNSAYGDCVDELATHLRSTFRSVVKACIQDAMQQAESAEGTDSRSYEVEVSRGGFFGGIIDFFAGKKSETRYEEFATVKAVYVRNALEGVTQMIQGGIEERCADYVAEWKKQVNTAIMRAVENSDIESGAIDVLAMGQIIRAVVNSIKEPQIHAQALPSELKQSGTLQGSDAEAFMDAARSYRNNLQSTMNESVKYYVNSVKNDLERWDISSVIVSRYREMIQKLEFDVQNKEASLDMYNRVFAELERISPAEL